MEVGAEPGFPLAHCRPLEGRAGFPGCDSKEKTWGKEGDRRGQGRGDSHVGSPSASHQPLSSPGLSHDPLSTQLAGHGDQGLSTWTSPGSY